MKYFLDTEFLEGPQKKKFLGITYGETPNTIDLISIGIVAEDGREYYAISKDFNVDEAWDRYQMKEVSGDARNRYPEGIKEYWLRENVLRPIYLELIKQAVNDPKYTKNHFGAVSFNKNDFRTMLNCYGETKEQIADGVKEFTLKPNTPFIVKDEDSFKPQFYAYYADYDWVVFCWLFGRMIDLPEGFPMYCIDLKQYLDERIQEHINKVAYDSGNHTILSEDEALKEIKGLHNYPDPKDYGEHNALGDAKWGFDFYIFLEKIF